jgi:hypothetical protein
MKFQRKLLTLLAGASLLGSGMATIGAADASAAPAVTCGYGTLYSGSSVIGYTLTCTGVTYKYRVYATCTDELRGSSSTFYGSYVTTGHTSQVVCPYEGGTQWLGSNPHAQHT